MPITKKVFLFLVVFIVLGVASLVLLKVGKSSLKNMNPLQDIGVDKINKIILKEATFAITAEKQNGRWVLTHPVKDDADGSILDRIVATLKGFTVGSVISEKKERYTEFELDDAKALAVQVYAEGKTSPSLDILLGKSGPNFGTTLMRFPNQTNVYLAENLPSYILTKSSESYRSRRVLRSVIESSNEIRIQMDKISYVLQRSSQNWVVQGASLPIQPHRVQILAQKISSLYVTQFIENELESSLTGLASPSMTMTVVSSIGEETIKVGQKISAKSAAADMKNNHLIQHSSRPQLMLVSGDSIKQLQDELKGLK